MTPLAAASRVHACIPNDCTKPARRRLRLPRLTGVSSTMCSAYALSPISPRGPTMQFEELSDDEWARIEGLLAAQPVRNTRCGRPRAQARAVANAVLWVLTTGECWAALPRRYPSSPTCRRRFDEWSADGTLAAIVERLRGGGRRVELRERTGSIDAKSHARARRRFQHNAFWSSPESWCASVVVGGAIEAGRDDRTPERGEGSAN
ncbi:transposase [Burkholderia thailandensis]|nr:transposase [Burkholderia thailandensis]AVR26796.1 transposase [Burkholderia thailandensis]MCS3394529.1 transposase [Burkholderia thailandensis]MCS6427636.1 transposase [Burkholderia thailandensis]MCS6454994.1 transposase [Burkholderia thailandensis]MCS6466801.1 transposase [Burkholderia thailandensis]